MKETEPLKQEEINELHKLIQDWFDKTDYRKSHMMGFLTSMIIGTMAIHGYDDDFFDATMDLMKKRFRKHPMRKIK